MEPLQKLKDLELTWRNCQITTAEYISILESWIKNLSDLQSKTRLQ